MLIGVSSLSNITDLNQLISVALNILKLKY
jgi:hypothetical protein